MPGLIKRLTVATWLVCGASLFVVPGQLAWSQPAPAGSCPDNPNQSQCVEVSQPSYDCATQAIVFDYSLNFVAQGAQIFFFIEGSHSIYGIPDGTYPGSYSQVMAGKWTDNPPPNGTWFLNWLATINFTSVGTDDQSQTSNNTYPEININVDCPNNPPPTTTPTTAPPPTTSPPTTSRPVPTTHPPTTVHPTTQVTAASPSTLPVSAIQSTSGTTASVSTTEATNNLQQTTRQSDLGKKSAAKPVRQPATKVWLWVVFGLIVSAVVVLTMVLGRKRGS